jgi:hypothetical protein
MQLRHWLVVEGLLVGRGLGDVSDTLVACATSLPGGSLLLEVGLAGFTRDIIDRLL